MMYFFSVVDLIEMYPNSLGDLGEEAVYNLIGEADFEKIDKRKEIKRMINYLNYKFDLKKSNENNNLFLCCFIKIMVLFLMLEKCVFEKAKLIKELFKCSEILEAFSISYMN